MSTVIRSLMVKVGADLTDMQKNLNQASKNLKSVGKSFSTAGASLTKSVTVPIVGAIAGLTALSVKAGHTADDLITMSNQTGIATSTLQELQYASRFVDVEVETMAKGLSKVVKAMGSATDSGQGFIEIADGVTVSMYDANGNIKDSEQVFYDSVDAIGSLKSETEKEIAAQQLFGKSYQDLMPLIQAGSEGLNKYAEEAKKLGLVISDEDLKAMGEFDDKMQSLQAVFEVAGAKIGMAFMPVIEKMLPIIQDKVAPAMQKFAEWLSNLIDKFSNASPGMQKFILAALASAIALGPVFSVIGKVTTGISGIVGATSRAKKAFDLAKGGITGVKAVFTAFMGPAGLVLLAIVAIAVAAFLIIKHWKQIKSFFKGLWDGVKQVFTGTLKFITALFLNFTPAGLIIKYWKPITGFFKGLWDGITGIFSGAWGVIKGVVNNILGGVEGMVNGAVKGVNLIIKGLNKILGLGGVVAKAMGFKGDLKIPKLKTASIPRLANGAVINPNKQFLAMLGDQKSGVNIETPLKTMVNAFETSLNKQGYSGGTLHHTGEIRVIGVNNQNELVGVTKILAEQIKRDSRRTPAAVVNVI